MGKQCEDQAGFKVCLFFVVVVLFFAILICFNVLLCTSSRGQKATNIHLNKEKLLTSELMAQKHAF